jgi:uncharacterized protein YqcC (DUF446 family)
MLLVEAPQLVTIPSFAKSICIAFTKSRKRWLQWHWAIRLYWMLRTQNPYPAVVRIESSPRVALVGAS